MAKKRKPTTRLSGPYVVAAVFCENPIEDKKGMISIVKLFDRIEGELPAVFGHDDTAMLRTWFFVAVKAGNAKGTHRLQLILAAPDGKKEVVSDSEIVLLGDEHGSNLRASLLLAIREEGLYWVDVVIDGKVLTRSPLRVVLREAPAPEADRSLASAKTPSRQ
jgi:hypothetical protein